MSEYYTDNSYENGNGQNQYNKRSFNDPQEGGQQGGYGGKRVKKGQDGIEMRCLVPARCAGAIIGKGGSNIKELRESFQASVFLPDGQANERVLKVSASPQNCGEVLLKVLPKLDENRNDRFNQQDDDQQGQGNTNAAIKLLVHQSQAGGIIGTKGVRIKELREKTGAFIKVHQECAGSSTDRICQVSGSHDVIADCVKLIMELLENIPPKGPVYNYDPNEDMGGYGGMDDFGYGGGFGGGYGGGSGFGGGDFGGAPRGFRGGRGGRGNRGGGRGGFGDRGGRGRGGRGGRGGGFRGGRGAQQQSHQY